MLTVNKRTSEGKEGVCLSTDTKPTDWENGSTLLEMDTKKVYIFDAANSTWREL